MIREILDHLQTPSTLTHTKRWIETPVGKAYVGRQNVYLNDRDTRVEVINVANIQVHRTGRGTFKALLFQLKQLGLPILVESIMNDRLYMYLRSEGFGRFNYDPSSLIWFIED